MTSGSLEFRATNLDCLLAPTIAFGLPVACGLLYPLTGALIPLALYYGVCCIGVVKWRRACQLPTTDPPAMHSLICDQQ